jgi:hypothetical protein
MAALSCNVTWNRLSSVLKLGKPIRRVQVLGLAASRAAAIQEKGTRSFFAAAALAMRHILVDNARHKQGDKHRREPAACAVARSSGPPPKEESDLLALDDALTRLA